MNTKIKKEISAYGVKVLLSQHPEIRKLKRVCTPTRHGNKFWTSSWLLMDYFKRQGLKEGSRVLEIGCGWGLAGIYCVKAHGAVVTGVDIDGDVLPFSQLHADVNNVDITFIKKRFEAITVKDLLNIDVLIGADICFWDDMASTLRKLIKRAIRANVKLILIADPIRSPFEELCKSFTEEGRGEVLDCFVYRPRRILGQILRISS